MDHGIQINFALPQPSARPVSGFPLHKVRYRRPGSGPVRRSIWPHFTLFWVLLVAGPVAAFLGNWFSHLDAAPLPVEMTENYLQSDHSEPTFKVISAAKPEVHKSAGSGPSSAEVEAPRILEPMGPVDPLDSESVLVYSSTLAQHQGDSPMLRNWKVFELAALVALAAPSPMLLAGGGGAQKDLDADAKEVLKRLDTAVADLKLRLNDMDKRLAEAFKKIGEEMADLKTEMTPSKGLSLKLETMDQTLAKIRTELEALRKNGDLKDRLAGIEQALAKMQVQTRTSLSPPAASMAHVKLVNLYPDTLVFLINGREHTVLPQQTTFVDVAAGQFTYRVLSPNHGWLEPHARVLASNETFTLSATLP